MKGQEAPKPPKAQVEIIYKDSEKSLSESFGFSGLEDFGRATESLQSLIAEQQKLMPGFEKNIDSVSGLFQRVNQLENLTVVAQKKLQEHLNHIGALIERLKQQDGQINTLNTSIGLHALQLDSLEEKLTEQEKKDKKLHVDIISAVKKENESLPAEIGKLKESIALCTLGLQTAQNVLDEQKAQIAVLVEKNAKLAKIETLLEVRKKLKEDIKLLQDQINYNNKTAYNDITSWKTHIQILGVLSMVNFAALCVAGWMWWQIHRS